jgi:hypothetical protein
LAIDLAPSKRAPELGSRPLPGALTRRERTTSSACGRPRLLVIPARRCARCEGFSGKLSREIPEFFPFFLAPNRRVASQPHHLTHRDRARDPVSDPRSAWYHR